MKNRKRNFISIVLRTFTACMFLSSAATSWALTSAERDFFGLTALESSHPNLDGTGYSVGVSDTEFDVLHPGLGWVGTAADGSYDDWYSNTNSIPELPLKNPRIASSAHAFRSSTTFKQHHGSSASSSGFLLPVGNNNTLSNRIWGFHGTAVAGTAAGQNSGSAVSSKGAAPGANFGFSGDSATLTYTVNQVPDGNPY